MGQKSSKKLQNQSPTKLIYSSPDLTTNKKTLPQLPAQCCICLDLCQTYQSMIRGNNCGHVFCTDCGRNWIQSEIASFSTGEIRCPNHTECGTKLDLTEIRGIISSEEFEKLSERQFESLVLSHPSFHRCRGTVAGTDAGSDDADRCSFVYEYVEDPSFCSSTFSSFEVGDEVFFYGASLYHLTPGVVVSKGGDHLEVKGCLPSDQELPPYRVEVTRVFHERNILQCGTEVEYLSGERSFFNRPKSYLITGARVKTDHAQSTKSLASASSSTSLTTHSSPQYVYDLMGRHDRMKPVVGVSYRELSFTSTKHIQAQHSYHCLQCHTTACRRCTLDHPHTTTCEEHELRYQQDQANILQMNAYRQNFLRNTLASSSTSHSTASASWSCVGGGASVVGNSGDLNLDATLKLLTKLEIRICRRCHNGVQKSSGCDKVMCRCGYKFCYHCGVEGAKCQCTPSSHVFINNVDGGYAS
jgi:hypothetical protein